MKKRLSVLFMLTTALLLISCGNAKKEGDSANLTGSLSEIADSIYANADLSQDFKDTMADFASGDIPQETAEYLIGTADVEYTESFYSVPMMNVVPYQLILLRLPEGADMEAAKKTIADSADPRKWVCVEAESVIVENVGDVILFVMGDSPTTNALLTSFLALAK